MVGRTLGSASLADASMVVVCCEYEREYGYVWLCRKGSTVDGESKEGRDENRQREESDEREVVKREKR